MANVFDLHIHPTIKPILRKPKKRQSPWEAFTVPVDNVMNNIFDSQSAFEQVHSTSKLVCISLHSLETDFAAVKAIQAAALTTKMVSRKVLRNVAKGSFTYPTFHKKEFEHFLAHQTYEKDGKTLTLKLIDKIGDYDPNNPHLHVILSVEGAHCFYVKDNITSSSADVRKAEFDAALTRFKAFRDQQRLLYLTLTHMSDNYYCNHAYPLPNFDKDGIMSRTPFRPTGDGISAEGFRMMEEALINSPNRKVLVDVKHMSLISRQQYYKWRKDNNVTAPLIGTHMGCTGLSWTKISDMIEKEYTDADSLALGRIVSWKKHKGYKLSDKNTHTTFNTTSINLYDEDIIEIMRSGGLIGLSMDERILGQFENIVDQDKGFGEIFSYDEYDRVKALSAMPDFTPLASTERGNTIDPNAGVDYKQSSDHLANNIMHYIEIGLQNGIEKPWSHLCFGSDYDGLINAVDSCKSFNQYPAFLKILGPTLAAMTTHSPFKDQITAEGIDVIVKGIEHDNALAFLKKNFQ